MFQIGMEGLGHYVHSNGDETLVIIIRVNLKEEIQFDCMQRALEMAAARYKLFHSVLASEGRGLVYKESSQKPVLQKTGKRFRLGSDMLSHFPYRVSCSGNELTASIHHGLTDGYGAMQFVKTLLYYYLRETGKPVLDEGMIKLNEVPFDADAEGECSYLKFFDPEMKPQQVEIGPVVPFALPVEYWDEKGDYRFKHYKLSLSAGEILSAAHRSGSSATAYVSALVNKAFQEAYDLDRKLLISSITSNFRRLFPSQTMRNFSGYFISFYTPDMQKLSLEETSAAMKEIIRTRNTKENALRIIHERTALARGYAEMPLDQIFEDKAAVRQEKRAVRQSVGYVLTNVGDIEISQSMNHWVEDMELYIPGITAPVVFGMNTVGDRMTLSVSQSFDDDTLIRSFGKVCADHGLTVTVRDLGTEEVDTLGIDAVELL